MKKAFRRIFGLGIVGITVAAFLFGLAVFAVPEGGSEIFNGQQENIVAHAGTDYVTSYPAFEIKEEDVKTYPSNSYTYSGKSVDSGRQRDYKAVDKKITEASATATITLKITNSNVVAALKNGRITAKITIAGSYRANAHTADSGYTATSWFHITAKSGYGTANELLVNDAGTNSNSGGSDRTYSKEFTKSVTAETITLEVKAYGQATTDSGRWLAEKYAESWAKLSITSINVELIFRKPSVTFTSGNSAMGSVSPTSGAPDLNSTASSTASPKTGYYFTGWTGTTTGTSLTKSSAYGYTFGKDATASYTAGFAAITKSHADKAEFYYTGNQQGVTVNAPNTNYSTTNYYRLKNSGNAWSTTKPTAAGTYEHYGTLTRGSEVQGTSATTEFTILKSNPQVTVDRAGQAFFGRPISDAKSLDGVTDEAYRSELAKKTVFMQVSAKNENYVTQAVPGTWAWDTPNALTALGENTYIITFTPTDTNNFNTVKKEVTLNGVSGMTLRLNDGVAGASGEIRLNPKSGDTTGSHIHTDGLAHVEVEFIKNGNEDYFLLGWRKNSVYLSDEYDGVTAHTCHFPLSTVGEDDVFAYIEAIVVKINGFADVSVPYTGNSYVPDFTFSQVESDVGLGYTDPTYRVKGGDVVGSIVGVGSYTAEMVYYLNKSVSGLGKNVNRYSKTITVDVVKNVVDVAVDKNASASYNETIGWARNFVLTLSVPNARSSAIERYQVSVNGEAWADIDQRIAASTGCAITYTPGVGTGSEVRSLRFRAVHATRGDNGVVAESEEDEELKFDNVTPNIDSVDVTTPVGDYDGSWTNQTVTFEFHVTHGGSGVIVQLLQPDGSWETVGDGAWNEGKENLSQSTVSVVYDRDTLLTGCRFRVLSGTEYSAEKAQPYDVRVDKSAPVLYQSTPKLEDWKNEAHEVILGVEESDSGNGYSGIDSISVQKMQYSGSWIEYTEWREDSDDVYSRGIRLTLHDRAIYRITVTDLADNEKTFDVQESVDTDSPEVDKVQGYVGDREYGAGDWTNQTVILNIDVISGGSGMQFYYTETPYGNIESAKVRIFQNAETDWELENKSYVKCTGRYQLRLSAEQNSTYKFYLRNRFGEETVYTFGEVKIDVTKPKYEFVTNLKLMQGDAQWRDSPQDCDVRIYDVASIAVTEPGGQVAQTAISGIKSFTVMNGALEIPTEFRGDNLYRISLDRASAYTIYIEDEAGNVTEHSFEVKIDCSEPTIGENNRDWSAELGDYDYNFRDWVSASTPLIITMNVTFTASGIRPVYTTNAGENVIWIPMIDMLSNENQVTVKNGYIYQLGNETKPNQSATLVFEWTRDIQTALIRFAVETGSGKRAEAEQKTEDDPQLKVDRTAPIVGEWSLNPDTATDDWTASAVTGQFSVTDGEGSGIISKKVKRFSADVATDVESVKRAWDTEGNEVSFDSEQNRVTMDTYAVYAVRIEDAARNVTYSQGVLVKIDTTKNFTLTYTAEVTGNTLNANGWMLNGKATLSFQIGGISGWGASSGWIEYSWDDGNTWVIAEGMANPSSMRPVLTLEKDQNRVYRFRAVTGAGTAAYAQDPYGFKRDGVQPSVFLSARKGSETYTGSWSADPVQIVATYTVGASGGRLYYMLTDSTTFPDADDLSLWEEWDVVAEGTNATTTYVFNADLTGKYMHVILLSGTDRQGRNHSVELNIDTKTPSAVPTATVNGDSYGFGAWTNQTVDVKVNALSGDSGYTVYYSYAPEGQTYGTEDALGRNTDELPVRSSVNGQYRFRVVSGAGKEFVTEPVEICIDKAPVSGSLTVANGRNLQSEGNTWWITDVTVRFSIDGSGASPVHAEVSVADEAEGWGAWTSFTDGFDYTIEDPSEKGGTQKYYRFRLINEAGTYTESTYVAGEDGLVRVDTNRYRISVVQMLEGTEAYCGSSAGIGTAYRRGDTPTVKVTALNGYWLKGAHTSDNQLNRSYTAEYENGKADDSFDLTVAGADITVTVDFYVETEITLVGLIQYLKSGKIQPVVAETPANFPLTLDYEIKYNNEVEVPQALGYYAVQLTVKQESVLYRLTDSTEALTVRYFPQTGDSESYEIDGVEDFPYIDEYFRRRDAGDTWLAVPAQPGFVQTQDIEITQSDVESGAYRISQKFEGATFDSKGYRIFATEPLRVGKNFHLFTEVKSSQLYNMGVEISLVIEEDGASDAPVLVSPLVGKLSDSFIMFTYVIGDITANGSYMQIGGLAGASYGTLYGYNFVDLAVEGRLTDSSVGSMAGEMNGGGIYYVYLLPRFNVSGERNSVGIIAGKLYGNLTDVTAGVSDLEKGKVYYRANGIGINGATQEPVGFGNVADNSLMNPYFDFVQQDHDWFLSCNDVIFERDSSEISESRRVKALTRVRINAYGVEGDGTEENPYLIKSVDDLDFLNLLPWAWFKLTADLNLSEYVGRLGVGIPFAGVLDGDNHRLSHYSVATDHSGGLFGTLSGTVMNLSLIDFNITVTGENAVAGVLASNIENGTLRNITVTGTLRADGTDVTVGGVAGAATASNFDDVAIQVHIKGTGETVYAGGIVGNANNIVTQSVVSLSTVNANFLLSNMAGLAYGSVNNQRDNSIAYVLQKSLYLNDKQALAVYGENLNAATPVGTYGYNYLMENHPGLQERLERVYPFRDGMGTQADPFLIYDYQDLLRINDYLYAEFRLANDILIGDNNGDGALTAEDGYTYDFKPIGQGAVFAGVLDGTGESYQGRTHLYRIDGLTDSLFETVTGTVKNLYLNVNYIVVDVKSDTHSMAVKVAKENENITFGAVAKYLRGDTASVRTVIVGGDISVSVKGNAKAVVGGVIGESHGGMVLGVISGANIAVNAPVAEVGGVAGYVRGLRLSAKDDAMPSLDINIPVGTVRVNGGLCSVGYLVGRQAGSADVDTSIEYDAEVYVNGEKVNVAPVGRGATLQVNRE